MEWPCVRLGDVAQEFISGGTPSTRVEHYWTGDIPWITGADVTEKVVMAGRKWITQEAIENSATHVVPKGAILLVTRTGVGKVAKAGADIAISQDLTGIVLKEGTNADFAVATIRQKARNLLDIQQGAIIKGVLRKDVKKLEIPLPPLSEQRRIVEILDQADHLRRLRAEADAKAERILPALFIKMFGDPTTNPMQWPSQRLSDIAVKFSDGPFGSNLKTSHYTADGVRVLRLQNVGVGVLLDHDKAFISRDHFASLAKHQCLPGDVIVATLGDPNVRAFVLPSHVPQALNKADCVQIRPKPGSAVAEYICWLLNSPGTVRMAERLMHGQTRTRISMGLLRGLSVPVPDYEFQVCFASQARSVTQAITKREQISENVRTLWNVLLQAAFTGQLTASWREAHMAELVQEMGHQTRVQAHTVVAP